MAIGNVMSSYIPGMERRQIGPQFPDQPFTWQDIEEQALDPYQAYRSMALGYLGQMPWRQAPRFEEAAMQGFGPAYGRYTLEGIGRTAFGGEPPPFEQYLTQAPQPYSDQYGVPIARPGVTQAWRDVVGASRRYLGQPGTYLGENTIPLPSMGAMGQIEDFPVENQLALAQAAMGLPGRGMLGRLARGGLAGQLSRWQRAIADPTSGYFGRPEAGFVGWLAPRLGAGRAGYVPLEDIEPGFVPPVQGWDETNPFPVVP